MFTRRNSNEELWWYPSLRYQNKSDDLWEQYQDGLFDKNRYLELLEEIKAEEIDREKKRYPSTGVSPKTIEKIENGIWRFEHKERKTREELARIKSFTPLERYIDLVPKTIKQYRNDANGYRRTANIFQMIIIIGSILATSATSALGFGLWDTLKWIAPVISIIVAISAGFIAYFKFKERSFNLQQTADAIEQELMAAVLGISYYKGKQQQEALELFAERVELLKDEQKKREQQLEQPPDIKHSQSNM
jgi:hypothetical protein